MNGLFSIGTSALLANQRALATTGHNIANANTEGYSRQRVDFSARQALGERIGQGVEANLIQRFNDPFAGARLNQSQAELAALDASSSLARRLDALLSSEAAGLAQPLRQFLDGVDALAADPGAQEVRSELLGEAQTLAQRFGQLQGGLDDFKRELNGRIGDSVERINSLSDALANLNEEIAFSIGTSGGQPPNDLFDQRDQLVSQLAKLVDVNTAEQDDGSLNVYFGSGQALVVGNQKQTLQAVPGATPQDPTRVFLGAGDISRQITGGELGGVLGFRAEVLDSAQQDLLALAQALTTTVNTAQSNGTDLNGLAGQALFAVSPPSARLTVLLNDPADLAAAGPGAPANSGDNSNALTLAEALRAPLIGTASAQEYNIALVSRVGSQARRLEAAETAQAALVAQHQNLRDEVSGVNLDEEAADLLRYQQAYQAAAQIIVVANEVFQSLLAAVR